MKKHINVDAGSLDTFFKRVKQAASGDFKKALELFLRGLGTEFLRILQDEIIRRKVMDTRLLLASFHEGGDDNIWEISDRGFTLEVGTNVKSAGYVNDGHWTNPKGVDGRFVPGYWEGGRFIYDPNADGGMALKQKWGEGSHYWEGALRIFDKILPELLDAKLQKWLNDYFDGF